MGRKFDLVISQSDERHVTETESFTYEAASGSGGRPNFVVSPRQLYTHPEVRLQSVSLTVTAQSTSTVWTLSHRPVLAKASVSPPPRSGPPLADWIAAAATALGTDGFEKLALESMRESFKADVAILQKRDLYQPGEGMKRPTDGAGLQEAIDRILWKGDFAIRLAVTGAALKAVVRRGREFDAQDGSTFNTGLEERRGLLVLGILADPEQGALLVNGEPIEDGRLYSVATTDYLAFGDTGYPELRNPAVPPPIRLVDLKHLAPLSHMLCAVLARHSPSLQGQCGRLEEDPAEYWDRISHMPFDARAGFTPLRRLAAWPEQGLLRKSPLEDKRSPAIDRAVQQRPVWWLALEKAETGLSLYGHNGDSEAALAGKFAGVPIGQVTAPNSASVNTAFRARLRRASRFGDWFAVGEEVYGRVSTRQGDGTFLEDQRGNLLAVETGLNPRLWPAVKRALEVKGILAFRAQTQVADPVTVFRTAGGAVRSTTNKTQYVSGRVGARYQSQQSWIEAGYQRGLVFGAPLRYVFNRGTPAERGCDARAVGTLRLAACAAQVVAPDGGRVSFHAETRALDQNGLFLNFRLQAPLPLGTGRSVVVENRGDFYFARRNDGPIDTRYFDSLGGYLLVPLVGNLSLVPKIEFWFYRNKVASYGFTSRQVSMGFQYRFDWRPGLPWGKSLKFPGR
jgi:hypothetical protein